MGLGHAIEEPDEQDSQFHRREPRARSDASLRLDEPRVRAGNGYRAREAVGRNGKPKYPKRVADGLRLARERIMRHALEAFLEV